MIPLLVFIFGLVLGSFLSVVFTRVEVDEAAVRKSRKSRRRQSKKVTKEILFGRSRCDHCHRQIPWYDNVPLVSFFLLRGKCRHCGKRISEYHPVLELVTALAVTACYLFYGLTAQFAVASLFSVILVLIFAYDLRHQIIPNVIVVPGILLALVTVLYQFVLFREHATLQLTLGSPDPDSYLLAAGVLGLFFLAMSVISHGRWIGGGDLKLAVLLGLLLGWPYAILAVVLAYFIGSAYAIVLLASHRASLQTAVPFGPMLIMGFFIAAFYGDAIINWYTGWML